MAWPNPLRRHNDRTRTCWGYTFDLTDTHLTKEQMDPLKQSYDVLGEECLEILDRISPPPRSALPRNSVLSEKEAHESVSPHSRDLYQILQDNAESEPKLKDLWTQINTVPDWVDWDQIRRGQDVFYRYGGANLTGLAYQSLLGGMGAARVVETLARTGGFSTKVARRRLFETTQHILECTRSLDSIQPGGKGFASTIRVRLLHAAVRRRILRLAKDRPSYYDVENWGVPINDLDSIATIGTFSATLIWLSLPRQGIFLAEQEILDYIALWRYIGYLIGCPHKYFDKPEKAKAMMEVLLMYEIDPSEMSQVLANNIILSLADNPPAYASADFLTAGARWLNGNELADRLGLMKPSLYYTFLVLGQCIFLAFWSYSYRFLPFLDHTKTDKLRDLYWKVVVESDFGLGGTATSFDFKYVPEFTTLTEVTSTGSIKPNMRGIEMRNLKALLLGIGGLSLFVWAGFKTSSFIVRGLYHLACKFVM